MGTATKDAPPRVVNLNPAHLLDSPLNPRMRYDQASIEELARSMSEVGFFGQLLGRQRRGGTSDGVPVVELVVGHRRKRAAAHAGIQTVPVELRDLSDEDVIAIQMAENVGREDMTPIEEADGFQRWVDAGDGHDVTAHIAEIAARVGRPVAFVRQRLVLAGAPSRVRTELDAGSIGVGHALIIAGLPEDLQDDALDFALDEEATLVELRSWAENHSQDLARAPWDLKDPKLHGGACSRCETRTGATADLFEGITGDRCLNAPCWAEKLAEHQKALAVPADLQKALAARGLELRPNGLRGSHPFTVFDYDGKQVVHPVHVDDVRAWLKGERRGWAKLPPKRKQGKPLPVAEEPKYGVAGQPQLQQPGKPLVQEHRDAEERRRAMLLRVLEVLPLTPQAGLQRPELELVLEHLLSIATGPEHDLVVAAVGAEAVGEVAIAELTSVELSRALLAASLAKCTNPYAQDDSPLTDTAKRLGVLEEPKAPGLVPGVNTLKPGQTLCDAHGPLKGKKKAPAKKKAKARKRAKAGAP